MFRSAFCSQHYFYVPLILLRNSNAQGTAKLLTSNQSKFLGMLKFSNCEKCVRNEREAHITISHADQSAFCSKIRIIKGRMLYNFFFQSRKSIGLTNKNS